MRRLILLLTLMAAMLVLASGVAWAVYKVGGPGNNVLYGTNKPDLLFGAEGNDVIYGLGGDDSGFNAGICWECGVLEGGSGNDTIYGGTGYDELCAGLCPGATINADPKERNVLYGGRHADGVAGAAGPDVLYGNAGDDFLEASLNTPTESRAAGNILYGGRGDDWLQASEYDRRPAPPLKDFVFCGPGTDVAEVDSQDVVAENCERIVRVPSSS